VSEVDDLIKNYRRFVGLPWQTHIAGPEKVWFAVYDPTQERRIRLRVGEFQIATQDAGHAWRQVDLTDSFARWMADHRYREAYFETPEDLELALQDYTTCVVDEVRAALTAPDVDEKTVVAIVGAASLFGLTHVSTVIEGAADDIRGRLLVFFPGHVEGSNYRLLDARDGWTYLAIPITA
jgi:hypothetical protein